MTKYSFKKLVQKKIAEASKEFLLTLRNDPSRSKSKNIWPSDEMKQYLKTNLLTTEEKLLLFSMKSRMLELKCNYKSKYKNNMNCVLCKKNVEESGSHLLECDELINEPSLSDEMNQIKYDNIYGNLSEEIQAAKIWKKVLKVRAIKIEERRRSLGPQVHQQSASSSCDSSQIVESSATDSDSSINVQLLYLNDSG